MNRPDCVGRLLFRNSGLDDAQQVAFSHRFADATDGVMEMGYGNECVDNPCVVRIWYGV
jgi:hypothetical protein